VLDASEGLFKRRVVVTRHRDVYELCCSNGIDAVLHDLPYRSDTVRLGLEAVGITDRCIFCPDKCLFCQADQPLLRRDTLSALALAGANDSKRIFRAAYGTLQASPVLFPGWTFGELRSLPEGKGGGVIAKKYPQFVAGVQVSDEHELVDVDTPEDLKRLSALA